MMFFVFFSRSRPAGQGSLLVIRAFGPPHRPHVAGGSARVFSYSAAWGLSGGPLYTLFHVYADKSGPMGEALFTLFAVFASLFGQGAEVPYFAGRGGPFLHAPARTNYLSPPKVRAWRAFLRGRWGAVFYQALAASGEEAQFTRYFTWS